MNKIQQIFELLQRTAFISSKLKNSLRGYTFRFQWNIIDKIVDTEKYWLKLTNTIFEYGEGKISDPSNILTLTEGDFVKYINGKLLHTDFQIQGKMSNLVHFEEVCDMIFPPERFGDNLNKRLAEVEISKKKLEKELKELGIKEKEKLNELGIKEKELKNKDLDTAQIEFLRKRKERREFYKKLILQINGLMEIYDEIKIIEIEKKLSKELKNYYTTVLKKDLIALIERLIVKKDISARIRGEYLTFIFNEKSDHKKKVIETSHLISKEISVLRGGAWEIEDNQSVFYFKVKVKNNSKFVITNIQIVLTSIPTGLISKSDNYKICLAN